MEKHNCPDCGTECTSWTPTGRTHYIECKNPQCRRHMITVSIEHWLKLTTAEIEAHHASHTTYAEAKAREAKSS